MNRNLLYSLVIIIITGGLGYYAFSKHDKENETPIKSIDLIPYHSTVLISEVENPSSFFNEIFNSNLLWKDLIEEKKYHDFEKFVLKSDSVFAKSENSVTNLVFALCENKNKYDFLFTLQFKETINLKDLKLDKNWHVIQIQQNILVSNSQELLTGIEKQIKESKSILDNVVFSQVFDEKVKKTNKSSVFINFNKIKNVFELGNQNLITDQNFGWGLFDVSLQPEIIFANGYIVDSNYQEVSHKINESFFQFIPKKFKEIIVFNFDTISQIKTDENYLEMLSKKCNCDAFYHSYNWIENQIVYFETKFNNFKYTALKVSSAKDLRRSLDYLTLDSLLLLQENTSLIYKINSTFDFSKILSSNVSFSHYIWKNEYIIFGESEQALNRILFQINNKETLEESKEIISFFNNNKTESSFYTRLSKGGIIKGESFKKGISLLQFSPDMKGKNYTSYSYSKEVGAEGENTQEKWRLNFDKMLSGSIYQTKNHRTNDLEYLVQDYSNNLFMTSPIGKFKWKKQLDGKIIGDIKTIDILNNKKYQVIFNTSNKLYVIDIFGKNVDGFPVSISEKLTNGISVMDYDLNGNYRFLLATSSGILSYDKNGKKVTGWMNPTQDNKVNSEIQHFVIQEKDYLLVQDIIGKIYFYNRKGEVRHSVSHTFNGNLKYLNIENDIKKTSVLYLDKNSNSIKKQFFGEELVTEVLSPNDSLKDFYFLDYNQDEKNDYVLVSDKDVIVFGKDKVFKKRISLDKGHKNLVINKKGVFYINSFKELIFISFQTNKTENFGAANDFVISKRKNKIHVIISANNSLRMIVI